ncbi:tRNA (guanosine(46)-N7)-methyltransferase TrmB [Desulfosarcina sp.]|uniref:tRNA (guanosine(46)-N7)-methyltransferase TrmB n=1 Tax=Desulfosarcina sp. TaxID=2027861 RepID=UPI003970D982
MPKNKLQKYERVRHLPNVTFPVFGESRSPDSYPWYEKRYAGMQKILELGCGKGEHSLAFAAADPRTLCVGIDRKSHRMCVGAEKALARGLENVHFLRTRIEHIQAFFVAESIHAIWLTFPDPHPKQRTIKCRLSAAPFLDAYATLLVPGGMLHLKTDSEPLFNFTRDSVDRWGGRVITTSENCPAAGDGSPGSAAGVSAYERAARSRGAAIKYLAFRLN